MNQRKRQPKSMSVVDLVKVWVKDSFLTIVLIKTRLVLSMTQGEVYADSCRFRIETPDF